MTFEIVPAIDLVGGEVVRLERGDLDTKTVFSDDPVGTAKRWGERGAARLHVVDLEGAVAGQPRQGEIVEAIISATAIPVQVSGGIRSVDAAAHWIDLGADRVVLGTAALTDAAVLREAVRRLSFRLVVAPDVMGREIRVAGWREGTGEDVVTAVRRLTEAGVPRLLVTDIGRDGMLSGPNVDLLAEVVEAAGVPVVASGGVATIDDLHRLAAIQGVEGAIVGKALYTGAIELSRALKEVA